MNRYEIEVSQERAEEFEAVLRGFGAKVLSIEQEGLGMDELRRRYLFNHKLTMAGLLVDHEDDQVNEGRQKGYQLLMNWMLDAGRDLEYSVEETSLLTSARLRNYEAYRGVVVNLLAKCADVPWRGVHPTDLVRISWEDRVIPPLYARDVVYFFGLDDGRQRSIKEVTEINGTGYSRTCERLLRARRQFRDSLGEIDGVVWNEK